MLSTRRVMPSGAPLDKTRPDFSVFSLVLVAMTPSTFASSAILDLFCTDEEPFLALTRILSGGPLPENVYDYIDPYQSKPENLPGEVWYYVRCNGNTDSSFGHWKRKGGDCKLYSNSPFTGWRTTYEYYEGQAPHEYKTGWVLQKYWVSRTDLCENSKRKENSSLCKVFLGDEQIQNQENVQKIECPIVPNSEPIELNHLLVVPDDSNNLANGSLSKSEMSEDDKMLELPVAGKPLDHHLDEIRSEMDCFSEGDFLELRDLESPASPSSSSENSSCLSMSSDGYFDTMAILRDLERDINHDTVQRDAACISSSAPTRLKKEVVHQGASESLVSIRRSHSPAEDNPETSSSVPAFGCKEPDSKLPSQIEKEDHRSEGASSSSSLAKMGSNGQETAMDGGKKKKKRSLSMKGIQKKYLCFLFSF